MSPRGFVFVPGDLVVSPSVEIHERKSFITDKLSSSIEYTDNHIVLSGSRDPGWPHGRASALGLLLASLTDCRRLNQTMRFRTV